jgi:Inner membrane protein YgaP-like, transmembrane domain
MSHDVSGYDRFSKAICQTIRRKYMSIDRLVLAWAGSIILISLLLSIAYSTYWLLLTAFVGVNLLQSSFTGFCPLAVVLKKAGVKPGVAFK